MHCILFWTRKKCPHCHLNKRLRVGPTADAPPIFWLAPWKLIMAVWHIQLAIVFLLILYTPQFIRKFGNLCLFLQLELKVNFTVGLLTNQTTIVAHLYGCVLCGLYFNHPTCVARKIVKMQRRNCYCFFLSQVSYHCAKLHWLSFCAGLLACLQKFGRSYSHG